MATSRKTPRKKPAPAVPKTGAVQATPANDYPALLAEVKARIQSAQYAALRAVNKELVGLYWDIGRLIVERQQSEGWGKAVVVQLAADLEAAFPGTGGFSASNLWRMKSFFETYSGAERLAPLVREIGWSHNLIILERCGVAQEREFYLRMTRKFGCSPKAPSVRGLFANSPRLRGVFGESTSISRPREANRRRGETVVRPIEGRARAGARRLAL